MTLEEVLGKLDDDGRAAVLSALEAEKQKGIGSYKKKSEEVDRLLKKYKPVSDLLDEYEIDPDSTEDLITAFKEKIAALQKVSSKDNPELKQLQRQLKDMADKFAAKEKSEAEARAKYQSSKIGEALSKLLSDTVAPEYIGEGLKAKGKIKFREEDEAIVWVDGDSELPIDKGVERFLKESPQLVKNKQTPGGGSAPSGRQPKDMQNVSSLEMLRMEK